MMPAWVPLAIVLAALAAGAVYFGTRRRPGG
jgi:hypothetical protein